MELQTNFRQDTYLMSEQARQAFDQHHSNLPTLWINPYYSTTPSQQMTPIKTSGSFSPSIHSDITGYSPAH